MMMLVLVLVLVLMLMLMMVIVNTVNKERDGVNSVQVCKLVEGLEPSPLSFSDSIGAQMSEENERIHC